MKEVWEGRTGEERAAFFYADDRLVESMYQVWLRSAFDTLTGLFDRVGICKNFGYTVGMLCRPCRVVGNQS